jgi:hypothetical protein
MRKKWLWLAVIGGGLFTVGFWGIILLGVVAVLMVVGGLGYHAQPLPPPLPTQAVYSSQWLNLVQHVDAANGFFAVYPAVFWIAAIQATSGGMPLDITSAGGRGLYDLPRHGMTGHPLAATNAFAVDLRDHTIPNNLQATLNAVGQTIAPAQPHWSAQFRTVLNQLEEGPEIAAWPLTVQWSRQITNAASAGRFGMTTSNSTVVWDYPRQTKIWVMATASAPVGAAYDLTWTPPYRLCTPPPPHSAQTTPSCHWVTDTITGQDIEAPTSMSLTTSRGHVVPMLPVDGPTKTVFVYPHAVLYVPTQKVLVNASHPATITARWGTEASVSTTLPGQGFNVGAALPISAAVSPGSLAIAVKKWGADIVAASQTTGVPADWIAGEMWEESKGNPLAGSPGGAYGLIQLEASTARSLPGWVPGARSNPRLSLLLGAEYLAENHQMFPSWRVTSASYEGGPGSVEDALAAHGLPYNTPWTNAVAAALAVYPIGTVDGDNALMSQYAEDVAAYAQDTQHDEPRWSF